ncbi:MAG: MBL fold metallo-hydrolase [Bacillota bacterium]
MLNKITDRVYYMDKNDETDRPALGLIMGDKFSLAVDAGASPTHAREFMTKAKELNAPEFKYVVLTHWHWDHIWGIPAMDFTCIGHINTKELLDGMRMLSWEDSAMEARIKSGEMAQFTYDCIKAEMPDSEDRVVGECDVYFSEKLEIDLGGVTCIVEHVGGDHTPDSTIVYVPEEKVMFLGDCIYGSRYNGEYGYTMEKLTGMVEKIRKYDAEYYLISHEELQNKEETLKIFDMQLSIGTLVGKETDSNMAIAKYKKEFGKDPDEDEIFTINCFANVNRALSKNQA